MRTLAIITLTMGMVAMASAAGAVSSVVVDYTGGGTGLPAPPGSVNAEIGDLLSFDIRVQIDSASVAGIGFDLQWEDNTNLVVASTAWETGQVFTSFSPPTAVTLLSPTGVLENQGNIPAGAGRVGNLGWFGLPPAPASTQIFLGSIVYRVVDGFGATGTQQLASGFFRTDGSSASDGTNFITPNFGAITLNAVPEPGLAALMGLGLIGLAVAGRRAKQ